MDEPNWQAPFWSNTTPNGECREWNRYRDKDGYGRAGRGKLAHRKAWELACGPIPPGMDVLHTCDNPPCIEPHHLFLGTAAVNHADKAAKGRCRNGWDTGHPNMVNSARPGQPRRKIADGDVPTIHRLYAEGLSQAKIGKRFGVRQNTISSVLRGATRYAEKAEAS